MENIFFSQALFIEKRGKPLFSQKVIIHQLGISRVKTVDKMTLIFMHILPLYLICG
jgi:hypothetical protein